VMTAYKRFPGHRFTYKEGETYTIDYFRYQ